MSEIYLTSTLICRQQCTAMRHVGYSLHKTTFTFTYNGSALLHARLRSEFWHNTISYTWISFKLRFIITQHQYNAVGPLDMTSDDVAVGWFQYTQCPLTTPFIPALHLIGTCILYIIHYTTSLIVSELSNLVCEDMKPLSAANLLQPAAYKGVLSSVDVCAPCSAKVRNCVPQGL